MHSLEHKQTVHASVGGENDPRDAYPIETHGKSVVTISGKGRMQAYLLRESALAALDRSRTKLLAASSTHGAGNTVHLRVPRKGHWYVVVTAAKANAPVGYALRLP